MVQAMPPTIAPERNSLKLICLGVRIRKASRYISALTPTETTMAAIFTGSPSDDEWDPKVEKRARAVEMSRKTTMNPKSSTMHTRREKKLGHRAMRKHHATALEG